ncbi:sulfatase-like hydrolase/transferase [uncultured Draconibacterium sp.]|uniref:sulfatase-like hydrolase/transferase n=1 Tax=uncultured Draconibacterium sp. TaxID=1573823 RepID=UPI0029C6A7C9|nr:sulfatase-like hydrolase/transferase [uncultured Draconibacterium sp.]
MYKKALTFFLLIFFAGSAFAQQKTNILFVFIDDMGFADLGCYGREDVHTPNIDRLASEGILFTQFYVNSPICSPSRTAVTTGQYPARWGITSYIDSRNANANRGMKNYLDLSAPSVARNIQAAGYYTAHIGKWHMGGGRDVGEAPLITEYGFDESVTQFEGLGERFLATYETLNLPDSTRGLEKQSARLGRGEVHWAKRENFTQIFVDRTIVAIENAQKANKPFYINLWPDDIHTPLEPPKELRGDLSTKARFLGVMEEMDKHMGRLFDYIRSNPELSDNTLIIFTSDNGPDKAVNTAGPLRGYKTVLYEGGFREPFISWWPSKMSKKKVGTKNTKTVMAAIDLPLVFMEIAGATPDENVDYDGELMLDAITGKKQQKRSKPIFWIRPPDRPGYDGNNAPDLAVRKGNYKLLMDFDGSNVQLYNLEKDMGETQNLKDKEPAKAAELKKELEEWFNNYPLDIDLTKYTFLKY